MLRRVDADEQPPRAAPARTPSEHLVPTIADADFDATLLPRDHPKWAKDALTLSQRARDAIACLHPIVLRVLTFWDHRLRSALISGAQVTIDPSGSYRTR
jgi:hypothetical protein